MKNGLDIVGEFKLEYLYADFYFLYGYPFKKIEPEVKK